MVCKILMSKSLEVKILRTKNLGRRYARCAYRLGLGHDRAGSVGGARSDVTLGLWKSFGSLDVLRMDSWRNCIEISSMWSTLLSRFHISKLFKSCWIKSCCTPPTGPRSARSETGPLWCATPCGNISAGWNCGPVKSATARATRDSRTPPRKRGVGKRRPCGRKNSAKPDSPRPDSPR
jgi:hypothetical protein